MDSRTTQSCIEKELAFRQSTIHPINKRIKRLREKSIKSKVTISSERAKIITDFYSNSDVKNLSILPHSRYP